MMTALLCSILSLATPNPELVQAITLWQSYETRYLENRAHFNALPFPQQAYDAGWRVAERCGSDKLAGQLNWFSIVYADGQLDQTRETTGQIIKTLQTIRKCT